MTPAINRRIAVAYHCLSRPEKLAPHVTLWMLRLLTLPTALRNFVRKDDFGNDDIAHALGLGHWIDSEDRPFNPKAVRAELYQQLEKAQQVCANVPLPPLLQRNVQRLTELVGLEAVGAQILAFAVCLRTDSLLEDAADQLEALTSMQLFQTLTKVLNVPDEQVRQALSSQGLLARSGLVVVNRREAFYLKSKLELLSRSFADQLMSCDADPIHMLRGKIQPTAPAHLRLADYGHIQSTLDIVRPWLRHAQGTQRRGVNLLVHGASGTGKTELARSLARDLGCELFEVATEDDDGDLSDATDRLRAYRAAQSLLSQRKALLLFNEAEDVFTATSLERSAAQTHKAWLNRMLENNPVPTLWLSNTVRGIDAAFIRRFDMVFELPVPPRSQRNRIIQAHCGELLGASQLARVANAEHLAPAVIARASAVVHAIKAEVGHTASAQAFEHLISHTLEAQGHGPLPRNASSWLPEVFDPTFVNADTDLIALAQGIAETRNARLCLYGPPGTGKTAFGHWLAKQLDMPLLVRRASDLLSKYVGEAEKNIARAFREAEEDGALLLIDEVDSFLQDRRSAQLNWEVTQVNEMLTQMEAFNGVLIASTNLMQGLDPAALRRFDLKIKLDFLRTEQACALLQRHCTQLGLPAPGAAEQARLARCRHLTPGDFATVLRQHRFRPVRGADAMVVALEAECTLKQDAQNPVGFV